jgi:hypothetical protein
MPRRSCHRSLSSTVAALALAAGAAQAGPAPDDTVNVDVSLPDVKALVAQAKSEARELARNGTWPGRDEAVRLALDEAFLELPPSMAFAGSELSHPREIVKNAPYTAEAITESIQMLPDGNRIVRKSTALLARDTQGRTRQERKGEGRGGVFIFDPMEGRTFVLNDAARTVTRLPRAPEPPAPPPPGATAPEPPTPPSPPPPGVSGGRDVTVQPGRVVVKRRSDGSEDVRVEVIRMGHGDDAMPPTPPLPPLALPLMPRGKGETKSLGTREFDGIKAEGTLVTHTIPAGQIGNEKPIAITSERWFSPDLFVVVYAKTSDPRSGDTIYRLANVKRGEPPADLFKVPADYRSRGDGRGRRS